MLKVEFLYIRLINSTVYIVHTVFGLQGYLNRHVVSIQHKHKHNLAHIQQSPSETKTKN